MVTTFESETRSLDGVGSLFAPASVAVVGAPGNAANLFARPLAQLVEYGFIGKIYPVNPRRSEISGLRCYASIDDIPEPVDLVLFLVPAAVAIKLIPAAAAAGAQAAVVFASGFGEAGTEGLRLQNDLTNTARDYGIRILGPNCQGVIVPRSRLYATFTPAVQPGPIREGSLAYIGQSGAVGGAILSLARERGIGLSAWLSTGNQADLDLLQVADYLLKDPATSTLAMYAESSLDAVQFRDLAARANSTKKSIVLLRSGRSRVGARAAASHTGAMIKSNPAIDLIAEQYGVTIAEDVDQFISLAHAADRLAPMHGSRVGVITTSGGAGSLAADHLSDTGLALDVFSAPLQEELGLVVPDYGSVENPVDVTAQLFRDGNFDDFRLVCETVSGADEVDGVLIVLTLVTDQLATDLAHYLLELRDRTAKPIALTWIAGRGQTAGARKVLAAAGVPVFDSPGEAAAALQSAVRRSAVPEVTASAWPESPSVAARLAELSGVVTEHAARPLMASAGLATPNSVLVTDAHQASQAAVGLTEPFVLKVQAASLPHKSERGGIVLGVPREDLADQVHELIERFSSDKIDGILIAEQAPTGIELLVGVTRDGVSDLPLLTVAVGGVMTELIGDTVTAIAPVSPAKALRLLRALRTAPMLTGYRGRPGVDIEKLADAVARISQIGVQAGARLREFEVNPLLAPFGEGDPPIALDVLGVFESEASE